MRRLLYIPLLALLFFSGGCVKQFQPEISEKEDLLVVEGLITDQPDIFTIRLSKAKPLWRKSQAVPVTKSTVWITDDLGSSYTLKELKAGEYVTDSTHFRGETGRQYVLHINISPQLGGLRYQSSPVTMKPVPQVDSIYYEKLGFVYNDENYEGCRIYLDTHDPSNNCRFYRWDFTETWEFHIPYDVANRICWISGKSEEVLIKNSTGLESDKVTRFPLYTISDPIDRLTVKYSMLVNQYSLNEDEYLYWESLRNLLEDVGGLYDVIPANIPNNIACLDDPEEKVLGYFSVSAVKSKRIFIKDRFTGINHIYDNCPTGTVYGTGAIPGINILVWVLYTGVTEDPPYTPFRVITDKIECADCRTRGTTTPPLFWK